MCLLHLLEEALLHQLEAALLNLLEVALLNLLEAALLHLLEAALLHLLEAALLQLLEKALLPLLDEGGISEKFVLHTILMQFQFGCNLRVFPVKSQSVKLWESQTNFCLQLCPIQDCETFRTEKFFPKRHRKYI